MIEQQEINFSKTFHFDCTLLLSHKSMYSSLLDSIFNEYNYFKESSFTPVFSRSTLDTFRLFVSSLEAYLNSRLYSRDQVFVYIDPEWHALLKEKLIPSLLLMEKDFISNEIDFVSFNKSDEAGKMPSNLDILKRVNFLYELLGKT